MQLRFNHVLGLIAIASGAIVLSQCSRGPMSTPTAPGSVSAPTSYLVGETTNSTPEFGKIKVCKAGNVSGTFTVSAVSLGGSPSVLSPITVDAGQCRTVAEDLTQTSGSNITVTETSAGLQGISGQRIDPVNGTPVISADNPPNGPITRQLNYVHGYSYTFTNNVVVEPPGVEGCTPGFWKQDQHLDSWTTYTPGADFDATFGVNFFDPNITLLEAAGNGGGGVNALGRHAVAALLNAASASVDYAFTTAQVLDIVQGDGAYSGLSVEARKNLLAAANEAGCPLN